MNKWSGRLWLAWRVLRGLPVVELRGVLRNAKVYGNVDLYGGALMEGTVLVTQRREQG